jgi:cyclin-dependent kinase-like
MLRLLTAANAPNIVNLKEAFRRKGKLYLVFEYMDKNLLELLEEQPNGLDPDLVRSYIYQLCQAIHWCHRHDVVHRDIKPENLLVNRDNTLKLCDFGFARMYPKRGEPLTDYVATRWYRAPELLLGSTAYDRSVDMWAIGCLMGECVDGQPMFPGESEIDQLYVIQKVLGPLTSSQMDLFLRNPRYMGLKFPDMSRPETLQKKYVGKVGKREMDFMKSVLQMKPKNRMNAKSSLEHPFFESIRPKVVEEMPLAKEQQIQDIPSFYNKSDMNNGPGQSRSNGPPKNGGAAHAQQQQQHQQNLTQQLQMQMQQFAPPKEDGRDAGYDPKSMGASRVQSQQNVPLHEQFESKPTASARDAGDPNAGFARYSEAKPAPKQSSGSRHGGGGSGVGSSGSGSSSSSISSSRHQQPSTLQAFNNFHAAPPANDDHSRFNKFERNRTGSSQAAPKDDPFMMGGNGGTSGAQAGISSLMAKQGKRESKRERRAEEKEKTPKSQGARRVQNRNDLALSEPKSMVKEAFFDFKGGRSGGMQAKGISNGANSHAPKQRNGQMVGGNGSGSSQGMRTKKKKQASKQNTPQQRGQFAWRPLPSFLETGNKPSSSHGELLVPILVALVVDKCSCR